MERRIKGLALLLFSVLLAVCLPPMEVGYFDLLFLEVPFALVYILVGIAGLALVFWPEKRDK